jgi:hypothetical protein
MQLRPGSNHGQERRRRSDGKTLSTVAGSEPPNSQLLAHDRKSAGEKGLTVPPPQSSLPAVRHRIVELVVHCRLDVARTAEGGSGRKRSVNKSTKVAGRRGLGVPAAQHWDAFGHQ